jgi:hypothetical protein
VCSSDLFSYSKVSGEGVSLGGGKACVDASRKIPVAPGVVAEVGVSRCNDGSTSVKSGMGVGFPGANFTTGISGEINTPKTPLKRKTHQTQNPPVKLSPPKNCVLRKP